MAVLQDRTDLRPLELSGIAERIIQGDAADPTNLGIRRAIEQANQSAGRRPEQHFAMQFGKDAWDGGNEIRIIEIDFGVGHNDNRIHTDIRPRADFEELRFGVRCELGVACTARMHIDITDESANVFQFTFDVLTADNGNEVVKDVFPWANGVPANLNFDEWLEVILRIETVAGPGGDLLNFRCTDRELVAAFYMPEDS